MTSAFLRARMKVTRQKKCLHGQNTFVKLRFVYLNLCYLYIFGISSWVWTTTEAMSVLSFYVCGHCLGCNSVTILQQDTAMTLQVRSWDQNKSRVRRWVPSERGEVGSEKGVIGSPLPTLGRHFSLTLQISVTLTKIRIQFRSRSVVYEAKKPRLPGCKLPKLFTSWGPKSRTGDRRTSFDQAGKGNQE